MTTKEFLKNNRNYKVSDTLINGSHRTQYISSESYKMDKSFAEKNLQQDPQMIEYSNKNQEKLKEAMESLNEKYPNVIAKEASQIYNNEKNHNK